ncbi:hypothetical protein JD844_001497 [Phrynosoma platyrhinos]|uniref:Pentraxin (PTX) domain-containing protein n=1 Tax=Phrynosoma platyrhinos TaxID=52577 RepID=A0ABQ7TAE5_PHRPL|nr:hypothetical protein JD844_001497 [Phrynosoma platyrhinos]
MTLSLDAKYQEFCFYAGKAQAVVEKKKEADTTQVASARFKIHINKSINQATPGGLRRPRPHYSQPLPPPTELIKKEKDRFRPTEEEGRVFQVTINANTCPLFPQHNRNSSLFSTSLRDALQKKISILEHQIHEKLNTSDHHTNGVPIVAGLRHKHISHGHSVEKAQYHISDPLCPPGHKLEKHSEDFRVGFPLRTNYMYVKVKPTLHHEIFAFSICLWLKSSSAPGMGTPFSYSVPGQANEVVLIEWGNNPMELLINDKAATLPLTINDAKWHHICVTWSTRDGIWESYQDGVRRGSGENLAPWHPIKPGGVFVLGQEQDTLGGRFDATQAFIGEISDFNMWGHILTPGEVYKMATCTSFAGGDLINWAEASIELHGGVVKLPFNACH